MRHAKALFVIGTALLSFAVAQDVRLGVIDLQQGKVLKTKSYKPTTLRSFTVSVPGPGMVLVQVSGVWRLDVDAISPSSESGVFYLGLCDRRDDSSTCGNTYIEYWHQDADHADNVDTTHSFIITRAIYVPRKGKRTFYLNAQVGNPDTTLYLGGSVKATVIFVPSKLDISMH
ncbi:MAG: hypothetical protein GXO18_08815 [Aquificae bacterium]|nr:hypothetical protein [Aquificota bacterium]